MIVIGFITKGKPHSSHRSSACGAKVVVAMTPVSKALIPKSKDSMTLKSRLGQGVKMNEIPTCHAKLES
jgi:hypothetical protein